MSLLKSKTTVAITAVVVLVALITAALIGRATAPGAQVGTAAATPTSQASPAASSSNACPALDQSTAMPTTAPPSTWDLVNKAAMPKTSGGPAVTNDLDRHCYAHTPLGALAAGANLLLAINTHGGADQVLNHQTSPGPQRDRIMAAKAAKPVTADQTVPQLMGYAVRSVTDSTASIEYAISIDGTLAVSLVELTWNGDWILDGNAPVEQGTGHRLDSLAGYIPWQGIGGTGHA